MQLEEYEPGTPLPFDGADNFRELGGYPVQDGRRVRRGIFWRAGAPAKLVSEHDRQLFDSLGIRTIFDFRSAAEREYLPDPAFPGVTLYEISAILDENGVEVNFDPRELAAQGRDAARRYLEEGIPQIYRRLPFDNPAYRKTGKQSVRTICLPIAGAPPPSGQHRPHSRNGPTIWPC